MKDITHLTNDELDALLLKHAKANWQKAAMVIAQAMRSYENWDSDRVTDRIVALVDTGALEGAGDVTNWRSSEVRLPGET